ncbi:MAG TPA: T9SS type A sorting domain-containing protein [Bacteroidia bacterium]|nr:T9SS type A sorting domain-containing protein [Bacteroidia bacterium]HRH07324.1 T9SS type A sorting domain-containing protein [Bacteroidia bacterium]HRH64349.1 T9SS type A sorting domain-containing protein [Bacteroidia bacterium]
MTRKYSYLILLALVVLNKYSYSQVTYTYDNNGNRIQRVLYVGPPSGERSFTPATTSIEKSTESDKIKKLATDFGITVFPTQVNELVAITIVTANQNTPAVVSIFDNLGKIVYELKIQDASEKLINFSNQKKGIYSICVSIKSQKLFYKVIK